MKQTKKSQNLQSAKSTSKPTSNLTSKFTSTTSLKPTAKSAPKSPAKSATKPTAKSVTKPATKSACAPQPPRALHIDTEALSSLALVQEGLLAPISQLANAKTLANPKSAYLTPFVLAPAGKRNQEILRTSTSGEVLDIISLGARVGSLRVQEVFHVDKYARTRELTGLDSGAEFDRIYARLGDYGVCGEYHVDFPDITHARNHLCAQIQALNAKSITGIVLDGQVFHMAHERLIRDVLAQSDLVVVFLLKPYRSTRIGYDLQRECVEFAMEHFLIKKRICIIPLDDTYLFMGPNHVLLHAMVARNYGCTHFVACDDTPNLASFYESDKLHSVLDVASDITTRIVGGYVYCTTCAMLTNHKTCPHGKHHHISYDAESIMEFFEAGLLPPSVLVRPEISAKLLSRLFPTRFHNLQKLHYNLIPHGVLPSQGSEEELYLTLMQLYEMNIK